MYNSHYLSPTTPPQSTYYDPTIVSYQTDDVDVYQPDSYCPKPWVSPMGRISMEMAETGSMAAQPGVQTPLATYAAQMVVWLWYGTHGHPLSPPSSYSDPFDVSINSPVLNPLQVQASDHFAQFVARLLQATNVSHSVTLVALLYIYRFKLRNGGITGAEGSERRVFVAALMLGNKYLDDNTYTNKTWSDLAGMSLKEVNHMEKEFLSGLNYVLGVKQREYQHWRKLLDGFMLSREREAWSRVYSPIDSYRTRSASPLVPYVFPPSPEIVRKRSAVDAFAHDLPMSVHEQMRLPSRKATFNSQLRAGSAPDGLARSSSLNRQIARMPGVRRGSAGQLVGGDLRHVATNHAAYCRQTDGFNALAAPFETTSDRPVPEPPLMFYSLAAEPHPGQDGAPRKAILHYQDPSYRYRYPESYPENSPIESYPLPSQYQESAYWRPEPAAFANAGPPGYSYEPHGVGHGGSDERYGNNVHSGDRLSVASDEYYSIETPIGEGGWRPRSEWSSPMPWRQNWGG